MTRSAHDTPTWISLALTPSRESARAAIEAFATWEDPSPRRGALPRGQHLATLLAQAQAPETCFALLGSDLGEGALAQQVFACWIQELVVRGAPVHDRAEVITFWRDLQERGH